MNDCKTENRGGKARWGGLASDWVLKRREDWEMGAKEGFGGDVEKKV